MLQKVLKIGNSLGVTLPNDFVEKNKIKGGSKISVIHSNSSITYSSHIPESTKYETVSDTEFLDIVKEVESKYKDALDELAKLP
jgi:putative addiction module antidote